MTYRLNTHQFYNWCKLQLLIDRGAEFLRNIFKEEWKKKYNRQWENNEEEGNRLLTDFPNFNKSSKIQKKALNSGDVNQWDITIIGAVFKELRFSDKAKKDFNKNLNRLVELRNKFAHNVTKNITDTEFEALWKEISDILKSLGDTEELNKLKNSISPIPFVKIGKDVEEMMELKLKGNEYFKNKDYDKAIELYSDAIVLPDIPNTDLAFLYSNRCLCYISKYNIDCIYLNLSEALKDAKKCKKNYPDWYKGYSRLGNVYFLMQNYDKAIKAYDMALNIEPDNEDLNQERAEARKKKGEYERTDHLDPGIKGKTFEILNEEHFQTTGKHLSGEQWQMMKEGMSIFNPILIDVFKGHDYRDGTSGCPQDYSMAVKHYGIASRKGNAEATYNLAKLTSEGLGTKKDFKLALSLLKKAASCNPIGLFGMPVVGVSEAEHVLGLCYQEGTYDEKNIIEAINWYERAIEHGNGRSANNLGLIYMNGEGVGMDLKKAEKLLLFAVEHKDFNAPSNLASLYMKMGFPEKAIKWNKKAIESGSMYADSMKGDIEAVAYQFNQQLESIGVLKWEKENNLSIDNLSIYDRINRFTKEEIPLLNKFVNSMEKISKLEAGINPNEKYKFDMKIIEKYKDTSLTAMKIHEAMSYFFGVIHILNSVEDTEEKFKEIVKNLASCCRIEHTVIEFDIDMSKRVKKIVNSVIDHCNRGKYDTKLDEDARLCFMVLNIEEKEKTINFATQSIKKYPNNIHFLEIRGSLYNFLKNHEEALKDFNKAIELDGNYYEVIYDKAATLRLLGQHEKALEFYEKFLKICPADHRKVPECYYAMGNCFVFPITEKKNKQNKLKEYYNLGLKAEEKQLPIYLPYESNSKVLLETCLESIGELKINSLSSDSKNQLFELKRIDPLRKKLIIGIRKFIEMIFLQKMQNDIYVSQGTTVPPKKQMVPSSFEGLKILYLNEMNRNIDKIMQGYIMQLTIVSELSTKTESIMFIAEDSNYDVQRVALYNFDRRSTQIKNLGVGSRLKIANPYLRMSRDGSLIIRVDDPQSVIFLQKVEAACFTCGKPNSKNVCSKCKISYYCSKECQEYDFKELQHNIICGKNK